MCFERRGGAAVQVRAQNVDETGSGVFFAIFHHPDFRSETIRPLDELSGWSGVQTELVGDSHLALRRDRGALFTKSHAWLVPQRRCRNLSIGEKKILSASK